MLERLLCWILLFSIDVGEVNVANVVSIDVGEVYITDIGVNISDPALLFENHSSGTNYFEGFDDLFNLCMPVTVMQDDDVDNLGMVISDGDDNIGTNSEDNPAFCRFGNASLEDISVVNSGGRQRSEKVE